MKSTPKSTMQFLFLVLASLLILNFEAYALPQLEETDSPQQRSKVDSYVAKELTAAGIGIETLAWHKQAQALSQYVGRWGSFTFTRTSMYWKVSGHMSREVALEIYNQPELRSVLQHIDLLIPTPEMALLKGRIETAEHLQKFVELMQAQEYRKIGAEPLAPVEMRNKAFRYPRTELADDTFLFAERNSPVFNKYNRSFPPPQFLIINSEEISQEISPAELLQLQQRKPVIAELFENTLQALDTDIAKELLSAGVGLENLPQRHDGEVPYKTIGRFGNFKFTRRWRYWSVSTERTVEFALADKIYNDPIGREVIRTNGYAGNISPKEAKRVDHYHIDTIEGLKRFMELVKLHNLNVLSGGTVCEVFFNR